MTAARDALDRLLALAKWPVALVALVLLPASAGSLWNLIVGCANRPEPLVPFLVGAALYAAAWWLFLRRPSWGSLLSTFEHELTHAIFAWLTLHRVIGLRATWRSGGHMKHTGKGNWLITIAPYWFPLAPVAIMVAFFWTPPQYLPWTSAALGLTAAYHVTSTYRETHRGQPDLRQVGWLFSAMFLPATNLIALGVVLAFAAAGAEGAVEHLREVVRQTGAWIAML